MVSAVPETALASKASCLQLGEHVNWSAVFEVQSGSLFGIWVTIGGERAIEGEQ